MTDFSQKHVVSSIPSFPYSYTSISLSPHRHNAILAGNDTLKLVGVSAAGLVELRSVRVSQYFFRASTSDTTTGSLPNSVAQHGDVREAFGLLTQKPTSTSASSLGSIVITDVAWSPSLCPQPVSDCDNALGTTISTMPEVSMATSNDKKSFLPMDHSAANTDNSLVAAAGSNGTVVVWHVAQALFPLTKEAHLSPTETAYANEFSRQNPHRRQDRQKQQQPTLFGQPEAILTGHSRAVNRLAFNPRKPHFLLTASQDATVKLWERRAIDSCNGSNASSVDGSSAAGGSVLLSLFGIHNNTLGGNKAKVADSSSPPSWQCVATFQPKSDAVRDIMWSPFHDDVFAMTTDSGYLIIYDTRVVARPFLRLAAHAGECTSVDWHPSRNFVLATGGGRDRSVKVWDVEQSLNLDSTIRTTYNTKLNSFSNRSDESGCIIMSDATSIDESSPLHAPLSSSPSINFLTIGPLNGNKTQQFSTALRPVSSAGRLQVKDRALKFLAASNIHTLSIGSPVTKLRWRPPSCALNNNSLSRTANRHDAMLAVATAPISGTNAVGRGSVALWSVHRPFLPLSVVKGHDEGPVADFIWLDTPSFHQISFDDSQRQSDDKSSYASIDSTKSRFTDVNDEGLSDVLLQRKLRSSRDQQLLSFQQESFSKNIFVHHQSYFEPVLVWQHIVSVGRDGQCLLQSFARGARPINKIPPSIIALAPFTPFKPGNGSLQLVSVHQDVPSGLMNDFYLTGLRCDLPAPGVFSENISLGVTLNQMVARQKSSAIPPDQLGAHIGRKNESSLLLTSIDCNSVAYAKPALTSSCHRVSPELLHFSHFARSYKHRFESRFPTRSSLCRHNCLIAKKVNEDSLERIWEILSTLLQGSDFDDPAATSQTTSVSGAFGFVLWRTLKKLLLQLADDGDVQTCVVIGEIMDVFVPESDFSAATVTSRVPGIEIDIIREWYLSYIEILQQHGLFLISTEIISTCRDPFIGGLNRNSTTIHESCSFCGKPLQGVTMYQENHQMDGGCARDFTQLRKRPVLTTQRACGYCRNRVGLCFICQLPVKDIFVWCCGCGHGGHLRHCFDWFADNTVCPSGCGHKCNLARHGASTSSFPIWMSNA